MRCWETARPLRCFLAWSEPPRKRAVGYLLEEPRQEEPRVPVISTAPLYQRYQAHSVPAVKAVADNPEVETVVLVAAARALFQLTSDSDLEALPASPHAKNGV